jgi:hypothetical protein
LTSVDPEVLSFDDLWGERYLTPVSVSVDGETRKFNAPFVSKDHLVRLKLKASTAPDRIEKWEQDKKDLESLRQLP